MAKSKNINFSDGNLKAIFIVFIGAIIAVTLISVISNQTNLSTNSFVTVNETFTIPTNVGETVDLGGRELVSATAIRSANASTILNLTLQTGTGASGLRSVQIVVDGPVVANTSQTGLASFTYLPDGYVGSSGGRSIVNLIVIFAALAIVVFVLVVFIKIGFLGKLMGRK